MLFLKAFKDAKFVVDGNAFQTFITLSTKNFCLMLAVHLGLNFIYREVQTQRTCIQCNLEQSGSMQQRTKCTNNSGPALGNWRP